MKFLLSKKKAILSAACIALLCVIFVLGCHYFFEKENNTNTYCFDLSACERKSAEYDIDRNCIIGNSGEDYYMASPVFILPKGNYIINIEYASTAESHVLVQASSSCVYSLVLPSTNGEKIQLADDHMRLIDDTDNGQMKFYLTKDGEISIYQIGIISDGRMYFDYEFYLFLFSVFIVFMILLVLFQDKIREHAGFERMLYIFCLLLIFFIVSIPFFQKNVLFGIDTRAQLLRIEGIFEGLQEGQFPVIIDPNYCNEYGQLGVLYPNLFLYIPALLRYFGISLEVSYRFFMILVNAMTVLIMFVSAKSLFHSSRWALASALFYCLEPYHLYVMLESGNGAGRGVAMAFLPMIFVGIYYIAIQNRKGWRWLAIGMWGIFSSHIIITFLAVGFLFVFCICNIKKFIHKAALLDLIKAIGLFGVLSAGTLLPFADFYFTDWNRQALEWSGFYGLQVHAGDIIRTPYSLLTLLFLFLAGVLFIVAYRKKLICESYYLKLYIAAVLLYFMTTAAMPWRLLGRFHIMNDLLNMIQVGHRFQTLISPIEAFLAGKLLQVFHHKKHTIYLYFLLGILLYCSLVCSYRIYFREGPLLPDAVTGNINSQFPEDYLPAGTKTEYYATNTGTLSDYNEIEDLTFQKIGTQIDYSYLCKKEGEYAEFPLFYYKGYYADNEFGKPLRIEKGTHNRIRVYLEKSGKPRTLHLRYRVQDKYLYAFLISCISIMAVAVLEIVNFCRNVFRRCRS